MDRVKYHFALDERNRVVSIDQVKSEREESHTYHCIGCGAKMIARMGKVRNWHFAHQANEDHCGSETYLHRLAKHLIREKFEKGPTFIIGYHRETKCSDMGHCPFAKKGECRDQKLETFDLKKYYDTCEEEKPIKGYVADLLLTNSQKPNLDPILIEIQVSHKSTPQKLDSGLRIIEICLRTEEDIERLLSAPSINESPEGINVNFREERTTGFAQFHGFKRESSDPIPLALRYIPRFYLYPNGKAYVTNYDDLNLKSCRCVGNKEIDYSIFEASIDCDYLADPSPFEYGYIAARDNGIQIRNCQLCKYHKSGYDYGSSPIFCCLYKKYNTPEEPEPQYAKECEYYREDKMRIEEIRKTMPPIVVAPNRKL